MAKPISRRYAVTEWLRKDLAGRVGFRDFARLMRRHPKLWLLLLRDLAIALGVTFVLMWLLEQLDPSSGFTPLLLGLTVPLLLALTAKLPGGLLSGRLLALKRAEQQREQADALLYVLKRTKREREIEPPS
ncbi:hypothetical protein [Streptosporangium sp. NPDC002524]|uniref:hypothetical protein n=1 Tax=Streptosporangium sp. NPDC002524 TaxID=3154537 RepID=UPI00333200C1